MNAMNVNGAMFVERGGDGKRALEAKWDVVESANDGRVEIRGMR